jgi:hypothetical protein
MYQFLFCIHQTNHRIFPFSIYLGAPIYIVVLLFKLIAFVGYTNCKASNEITKSSNDDCVSHCDAFQCLYVLCMSEADNYPEQTQLKAMKTHTSSILCYCVDAKIWKLAV